jgi:hypothetical protein
MGRREGRLGNNGGGERVQSSLYTCIELSQWNSHVSLMYTNSKYKKKDVFIPQSYCFGFIYYTLGRFPKSKTRVNLNIFLCNISFLIVLGFELRALLLLGKCSTIWFTFPALFTLVIFSDRVSCFLPGPAYHQNLLIYTFCIHGITGMYYHDKSAGNIWISIMHLLC